MLVSVVLLLYNSMGFLKETMDSILSQTFTDFELIIIDDCSTDGLYKTCKGYNDDRIKLHRNKINAGVFKAGPKAYELSTGKYFLVAGHDDIISPNYLESLIVPLEEDNDVVIAFPDIYTIRYNDSYEGKELLDLSELYEDVDCIENAKTYMFMPESGGKANIYHSLIRKSAMEKTATLFKPYNVVGWGDDYLHIFHLMLSGKIKHVKDTYLYKRIIPGNRWSGKGDIGPAKKDYLNTYKSIIKSYPLPDDIRISLLKEADKKVTQGIR